MKKESCPIVSLSVLLALLCVGLAGCAPAPKEDLAEVKAALDELKASKSDVYAPEAFKSAEDAYKFAMVEIQEQQEKFALFRSYSHAEVLITEAMRAIKDAKEEAKANLEEARM